MKAYGWRCIYNADLVHYYGTILQFIVQQSPNHPEDTFELVFEHFVFVY
jgi:hypothetical protein